MKNLTRIDKLRFWAHKVIPLVYDDSLSYYEFLCKVVQKVNEVIESDSEQSTTIEEFGQVLEDTLEELDLKLQNMQEQVDTAVDNAEQATRDANASKEAADLATQAANTAAQHAEATAIRYGTPYAVTSSSDMTDHDYIYVYTGATDGGFTQGNWYYWNGTAWTSGGVYVGDISDAVLFSTAQSKTDAEKAQARENAGAAEIGIESWIGYAENQFLSEFETTHSSNWSVINSSGSVVITHLTSYVTGFPKAGLDLEPGNYKYTADYNGGSNLLALYKETDTYVKSLSENDTITIAEGETYYLRIGVSLAVNESVTISDIKIVPSSVSGKIQTIETDVDDLEKSVDLLDEIVDDISQPVYGEITGSEEIDKIITPTGATATAGGDTYRVVTYSITAGKSCKITASANWGNAFYGFYDNSDALISLSDLTVSSATFEAITDYEVTAPTGATVLKVAYNTTKNSASVITILRYVTGGIWSGLKWVCVGDSLTEENSRTSIHYFDYVSDATGITVVNMGVSGSGYAKLSDESKAFYQRISSCPTDADVVTIFGSFNDLGSGLSLGSVTDSGTTTIAGCINTTIDNLQAIIPLVNLGIVAPTPWDTTQPSTSGNAYNYVEMLKAICEHRSIPFLDLWRDSNLRPWDSDFRAVAYSHDGGSGTHPDENGHKLIAPRFQSFLDSLLIH